MVPYHRTFDAMAGMFGWMFNIAEIKSIRGMDFLEIGTGQYINHPMCAVVCGAKNVVTYDIKDNRVENYMESFNHAIMAKRFLSCLTPNFTILDANRIKCTTALPEEVFDIIFSYSVLEHVSPEAIDSLLIYLKKHSDKYTLHYIDVADSNRNNDLSALDWGRAFRMFSWRVEEFPADDGSYTIIKTREKRNIA